MGAPSDPRLSAAKMGQRRPRCLWRAGPQWDQNAWLRTTAKVAAPECGAPALTAKVSGKVSDSSRGHGALANSVSEPVMARSVPVSYTHLTLPTSDLV